MSSELANLESGMSLVLTGEPDKQIVQAERACTALMKVVKERKLFERIGKNNHLKIEAWLLLGHFFGVTPRVVSVFPVVDEMTSASGYEATVEVVHLQSNRVIGQAIARCLNNEDNWSTRPKYEGKDDNRRAVGTVDVPSYQLESMAQTRASSKALASVLRWVVVLGGGDLDKVEGTPAEEMHGTTAQQEAGEQASGSAKRISEGQRKRIFAIAKEVGFPTANLPALIKGFGFNIAPEITVDKYDALVAEIQNWNSPKGPGNAV